MTEPAQATKATGPEEQIMLRVADEVGVETGDLLAIIRTVKWSGFEVGKPIPGELGKVYVCLALFHGSKGKPGEDGLRVPQEQRAYAVPAVAGAPFLRLTYVPAWWGNEARHEQMGLDDFVEQVAEEFSIVLELDDGDECPQCGADVAEDAVFCAQCGSKLPEEEETPAEPTEPVPPGAQPS